MNTYNIAVRMKLCLEEYMREYPAFKSKPIGAPHSDARVHQKKMSDLEVDAKHAIMDWMEFDK